MRMYDLIHAKKRGEALSEAQIRFWVDGVVQGSIPDEQSASMLMAICWRGMTTEETLALTLAMRDSGKVMDLSSIPGVKVDKHSTGGVGDKTTLILGPLVAACGVPCAMFSGRGLGHTGGTVDKFAAVPGLRVELSDADFLKSLRETGFANSAQTPDLVPADRRLYALRDVTATVESIPLITASIMSKKLAGGCGALVLDVKCGSAAFMSNLEEARGLARSLVSVGKAYGMRVKALITRMEEPLGRTIGNALEVRECIEILQGRHAHGDLARMSLRLAAEMVVLGGRARDLAMAEALVSEALTSGRALEVLRAFIALHGGDAQVVEAPERLPQAPFRRVVRAASAGTVVAMDGRELGLAAMELGAGRRSQQDVIDPAVGLELEVAVGAHVAPGAPLATLHGRTEADLDGVQGRVLAAIRVGAVTEVSNPWLLETLE
ncbi:MAG TPA: thymidine phosphorylase [Holophagaceae bacterium]|nr:thymidine phosphorylase [Holophagaceae bacterium]HJW32254.1 thymidine phosphorylase [Holophagaceae bacterium]